MPSRYGPLLRGVAHWSQPVTVLPQFRPQSQNTVSRRGRVRENRSAANEKRNPAARNFVPVVVVIVVHAIAVTPVIVVDVDVHRAAADNIRL